MNRRSLFLGLSTVAAPFVIRTPGLLMPVRRVSFSRTWYAATFPCGLGDGSSWQNAAPFWQAMAKARPCDHIILTEMSGFEAGEIATSPLVQIVSRDVYRQTRTYRTIGILTV